MNSAMCILFFAIDAHPQFPLIFAFNRDMEYDRPTLPLHIWSPLSINADATDVPAPSSSSAASSRNEPIVLGGRDSFAGITDTHLYWFTC
jgi:hypothetical protein